MPREQFDKRKPYAEVLVAALLAHVNAPKPPNTLEDISVIAEGNSLRVKGTPKEFVKLIDHYSQSADFAAKKTSLTKYRRLSLNRHDQIRDTISDMRSDRLGLTDEKERKKGDNAIRMIENLYGLEHSSLPLLKSNLASVHLYLNELNDSGNLYNESLKLATKIYGNKHPVVADICTDFAMLLCRYPQQRHLARQLLAKAINIFDAVAPNHPHRDLTVVKMDTILSPDFAE